MEGSDYDFKKLYPPPNPAGLRRLLHAIHSSTDNKSKKDYALYYLLKDYDAFSSSSDAQIEIGNEGMEVDDEQVGEEDVFGGNNQKEVVSSRSKQFASKRCIPVMWTIVVDGYWDLDHGLWEVSLSLCKAKQS